MDCSTRNQSTEIEVKNLDHLGLVAGIIDEIGIVEIINEQVSIERGEIVTAGQVVKAIILNGLGFVSGSLYLFPQFFEDKATEHLLGEGIEPKHLNDDKIGRVMDKLYQLNVSVILLLISLAAVKKFGVATENSHLDSRLFWFLCGNEFYTDSFFRKIVLKVLPDKHFRIP